MSTEPAQHSDAYLKENIISMQKNDSQFKRQAKRGPTALMS